MKEKGAIVIDANRSLREIAKDIIERGVKEMEANV